MSQNYNTMHVNHPIIICKTTNFPIGIDSKGILRYYNKPNGTYANAVVHGLPFDYNTIDKINITSPKLFYPKSKLYFGLTEKIEIVFHHDNESDTEYSNEIDFIESTEYQAEKKYQRGIRIHGDCKKMRRVNNRDKYNYKKKMIKKPSRKIWLDKNNFIMD
ncbi:hypothetical protein [Powai lake megavirus]|uniref:Uncharacterized protein n=1 Tax=Powai lake megavirus TaxID=1842663 RepID=A0A167RJR1_9VIRU|nr:hypothetical protein QJ849_gp605 [Powai lake megavirus]ANB50767.1 hypothetical protein [Powai lake megavirus]